MLTAAQLAANRRNAQRSTGPKTPEGKARSRGNALKHGLTSTTVLPPEEDAEFHERLEDWNNSLEPENPVEAFLVRTAVLASVKLDRCARADFAHVAVARRATIAAWEEEQQARLSQTLADLANQPAAAVSLLEEFATGCDWLMGQWNRLAEALDTTGAWTAEQRAEAERLLALRADDAANPDPRIAVVHAYLTGPDRRILVQAQLDRLAALRDELWETQEGPALAERINIAVMDTSPAGSLRHRYQLAAFQQFFRSLKSLEARHAARTESDEPATVPDAVTRLLPPARPQPLANSPAAAARNEAKPSPSAQPATTCAPGCAASRNEPRRFRARVQVQTPLPPIAARCDGPQPPPRSAETLSESV